MNPCSVTLLFSVCCILSVSSLTINMNQISPSKTIVMILRKSQPSMILFPNDEKIVINTSGKQFWKINMKQGEESVTFGGLKQTEQKEQSHRLEGQYKVSSQDRSNMAHPNSILFNGTHISYQICSKNICEYHQDGQSIFFNKCSLTQTKSCEPFSNLYYQDLQFVVHLQLIVKFEIKGKQVKFYDADQGLRLLLDKKS